MSDEDCIICSKWPSKDRWALQEMITELPLREEPICDEGLPAFAVRLFGACSGETRSRPLLHATNVLDFCRNLG